MPPGCQAQPSTRRPTGGCIFWDTVLEQGVELMRYRSLGSVAKALAGRPWGGLQVPAGKCYPSTVTHDATTDVREHWAIGCLAHVPQPSGATIEFRHPRLQWGGRARVPHWPTYLCGGQLNEPYSRNAHGPVASRARRRRVAFGLARPLRVPRSLASCRGLMPRESCQGADHLEGSWILRRRPVRHADDAR